jgi:UDP-N-acetylmuramoyl-tripeptide--D-alanyl-D-alanine ligase
VTLIDDAYNANPASFRAALDTLLAMSNGGGHRLFVVAGDMLELGDSADAQHRDLGKRLAGLNLEGLFTVGDLAHRAGLSAIESGLPRVAWNHCQSPEEAALSLRPTLREGDVVLVKGSNGVNLDRCCQLLSA